MNIAFLVGRSINGGGAERASVNLANETANSLNRVFVFSGPRAVDDYSLNHKVHRVIVFYQYYLMDCLRLIKAIKKNSIDVVIAMGIYASLCACLVRFFIDVKVIVSERNSPKHDLISWKSKLLRFLLYRLADGFVFQTKQAKEFYSKEIQKRSVVIHNPIKPNLPIKSILEKKEIVAVGRLEQQKNYPLLIEAFSLVHKNYPEFILKIYGRGKEEKRLSNIVNKLNLTDNVLFQGFSDDVHNKIKDAQIFVLSSSFEGMPNSLMEAMAMGFPVVSTDCPCGGPGELIINEVNGLLVQSNPNDLAKALCKLIDSQKLRKSIGEKASCISKTHNVSLIANQWLKFIEQLVV